MITMHDFFSRANPLLELLFFCLLSPSLACVIEVLFCANVSVICCWSFKTCMRAFIRIFFVFDSVCLWICICISGGCSLLCGRLFFYFIHSSDTLIRTHFWSQNISTKLRCKCPFHIFFSSALRRNSSNASTSIHFLHFVHGFLFVHLCGNVIDMHCSNRKFNWFLLFFSVTVDKFNLTEPRMCHRNKSKNSFIHWIELAAIRI